MVGRYDGHIEIFQFTFKSFVWAVVKRREFITLLSSTVALWRGLWPIAARAQYQMPPPYPAPAYQPQQMPPPPQQATAAAPADNSVGQVATVQGSATVTRANAAVAVLQVADPIFKNDTLETGADSSLGVTFDDETTFSLSADTRIVVNEFVYQEGGSGNAASFNVAIGTAAFVASLVAKTGDMKIRRRTLRSAFAARPAWSTYRRRAGRRSTDHKTLSGRGRPCWADRSLRPAGRPARHADPGRERVCTAPWRRRTPRGGALPNPAAGSGTRPRRAAAA